LSYILHARQTCSCSRSQPVAKQLLKYTNIRLLPGYLSTLLSGPSTHWQDDVSTLQVCVFTAPLFSAFCALATFFFMREVHQQQRSSSSTGVVIVSCASPQ
jgi:hypothetical protein